MKCLGNSQIACQCERTRKTDLPGSPKDADKYIARGSNGPTDYFMRRLSVLFYSSSPIIALVGGQFP